MKKLLLVLAILTSTFEGCRYDDGPLISLRTARHRLYGDHTLVKYTVDGIDSLTQYYDYFGLTFNFVHNDDNGSDICIMNGNRKDGSGTDFYWGWTLTDNNKRIDAFALTGATQISLGPFGQSISPAWTILKLTYKEVELKTSYNNKEYLILLDRK
jgi:hypothetical protein